MGRLSAVTLPMTRRYSDGFYLSHAGTFMSLVRPQLISHNQGIFSKGGKGGVQLSKLYINLTIKGLYINYSIFHLFMAGQKSG